MSPKDLVDHRVLVTPRLNTGWEIDKTVRRQDQYVRSRVRKDLKCQRRFPKETESFSSFQNSRVISRDDYS